MYLSVVECYAVWEEDDNAVLNELLRPGYGIRHVDRERRGGGVTLIYN